MINKILAVDDNPVDLTRLEKLLTGAGYHVTTVSDGKKAIEVAQSTPPDAILMDVNMPNMDGFAATRALTNNDETKNIPIIIISSKDQKADKAWGQMVGAKGYVTKPYSDDDVLNKLTSL